MVEHTTRAFDADLHELARKIADLGRLDDEQIANATEALVRCDIAVARRVISPDDRIDALQCDIGQKAVTTIAQVNRWRFDPREIVGAAHFQAGWRSRRKHGRAGAAADR